jgi:hypothetical protein
MNPEQRHSNLASDPMLPDHDGGLLTGGIYAFKLQSAATRMLLMTRALSENLRRGIGCTVITQLPIKAFVRYCDARTADVFLGAIKAGDLQFFSPMGDYKTNICRFGPGRFVRELEQFAASKQSFLVMDQADLLFTTEDPGAVSLQASVYLEWARRTQNVALFLFPDTAELSPRGIYFQTLANHFSGIAGFYICGDKLEIGIDFWTLESGIMMAQPLPVISGERGQIDIGLSLAANRRLKRRSPKQHALEKATVRPLDRAAFTANNNNE